jgi:hypothetical protein
MFLLTPFGGEGDASGASERSCGPPVNSLPCASALHEAFSACPRITRKTPNAMNGQPCRTDPPLLPRNAARSRCSLAARVALFALDAVPTVEQSMTSAWDGPWAISPGPGKCGANPPRTRRCNRRRRPHRATVSTARWEGVANGRPGSQKTARARPDSADRPRGTRRPAHGRD